jgi:phosphoribosylformylglycinamidine cyclo-ligase
VPPLFEMIQTESATPWAEMYKVFNMGHRFEFYVPEDVAGQIIAISERFGVAARVVGRVEVATGRSLTIESEHGTFTY